MTVAESQNIVLSEFTPAHLDGALQLSQAVSWPHRHEDWALALSISVGVVALEGERVVGTALCSLFGDVATLNMIIVDARLQGRGLGRKLMDRAIEAANGRELRLIATAEGLPLYEKMGFARTGMVKQFQGTAQSAVPEQPVHVASLPSVSHLAKLDQAATGMERKELLSKVVDAGVVLETDGGFAMLRPFGRGFVLGPIVAENQGAAEALIAAGAARVEGQFLRIDFPASQDLDAMAKRIGLEHVGGGTAMARDLKIPTASDAQTFALVSQAFG